MPQLTLTISKNINANLIDFKNFFRQIHETLSVVPDMDVNTAHAGVIQESFSYIGFDNPKATKVYLQLYWLENKARTALKLALGKAFLNILENTIVPEVEKQGFICIPRIRIANLGELNQSYFIGGKQR
ncbi:hypothetical protein [Legionella rowbothamii]|uniref:hypothetical protein n=1 Tax=Legionella rowbothamii TaxID=96229 RepID=UPI001054B343|nr:hypothetical protein [Legionella rowbothamii]